MLQAEHSIPSHRREGKFLAVLCFLFGLKGAYLALVIGASALAILFILTIILDALLELCHHVAEIWLASNSIERLLVFLVAWLFFYKLSPTIARVTRHCRRVM